MNQMYSYIINLSNGEVRIMSTKQAISLALDSDIEYTVIPM